MDKEQNGSETQPKPATSVVPPFSGPLAKFEAWLYSLLVTKAPFQIPVKAKEVIVKIAPWVTLVVALISLPAIFAVFTISSYVGTMYGAYVMAAIGPVYYVSVAVLVVQVVLMALSIAPLMKQKRSGWLLVFYSSTISVVYSVVNTFSYGFNIATLLGGLIGAAISYYVLFQVRSYYKN